MKVGFIGAGNMAEAIISSMIAAKTLAPHEILACDLGGHRRRQVRSRFGISVYSRAKSVVDGADILFLCIKPQDMAAALEPIAHEITQKHLVISIAAGKTLAAIEGLLPEVRVVRVMPNLPCVVGEGMSVFCLGTKANQEDRILARLLLGCSGRTMELPEESFDAVTALSGSGPAFFALLLDCMVVAAGKMGIERKEALTLVEQTMLGTAKLLLERGTDPQDLITAVSSPGGTTVEGLSVLEASNVDEILRDTLMAAARRSSELGS